MTTLNHNQEKPTVTPEIKLSSEQQTVFDEMEKYHQHMFITGRAGTGKSVLLRHFRENTKKRVVVAAPTGIAALNVKGQTVHSLFKLPPQLHRRGKLFRNSRVCSLLKRIDTLVIDEISMVRADLLDAINERLQEAFNTDIPFGGVQVIMFGDPYQLPPVVDEGLVDYFEAIHNGYFFFNALVWREAEFKIYELTQVFRQKDPVFKDILNAVREGSFTDEHVEQLNVRYGIPIPTEGTITLATTNSLVTNINQQKLYQLGGELHEYKAVITGEMKRSVFPTEENLQLKVGAQIVMLKNDKNGRWVNGTVGKVERLKTAKSDDETSEINVCINGISYTLERETWEEIVYEYDQKTQKVESHTASSFTQFPIRLAWAMTIHKSQGQTYESVALDLTTATFAPGQLYVALSRCTSLEGLYLKMPVKCGHIIVDSKVSAFMSRRETIKVEAVEEVVVEPESDTKEICTQNNADIIETPQIEEVKDTVSYAQNTEQQIEIETDQEIETCIQNNEGAGRKRKPGGGRKRKVDLERVSVKLSKTQIEKTSDIDRSELIRGLLDANGISDVLAGKFYTYLLMCPDGSIFYVGKGQGNRIDEHEREAKRGKQSEKCDIIRQIWAEGEQIIKQKVAFFDDEGLAYRFESLLISFFDESIANIRREKVGRTEKERVSPRGRKTKGDAIRQPVQLSLDISTIQILKAMDINKSELFEKLLNQYEPFLEMKRSLDT